MINPDVLMMLFGTGSNGTHVLFNIDLPTLAGDAAYVLICQSVILDEWNATETFLNRRLIVLMLHLLSALLVLLRVGPTKVKIQVEVLWAVMPCCFVVT
jgi:hypothetical protein